MAFLQSSLDCLELKYHPDSSRMIQEVQLHLSNISKQPIFISSHQLFRSIDFHRFSYFPINHQGLVTVPFWESWTSPYSSSHLMTHESSEDFFTMPSHPP